MDKVQAIRVVAFNLAQYRISDPEVQERCLLNMYEALAEYVATMKRTATQGQNRMERVGMNRAQ